MTYVIELDPETEAALACEARLSGVAPEKLLHEILWDRLKNRRGAGRVLTHEEIDDLAERLSEGSEKLPILPPEVNDRESYYEGRP
jgi:hypothetical protein